MILKILFCPYLITIIVYPTIDFELPIILGRLCSHLNALILYPRYLSDDPMRLVHPTIDLGSRYFNLIPNSVDFCLCFGVPVDISSPEGRSRVLIEMVYSTYHIKHCGKHKVDVSTIEATCRIKDQRKGLKKKTDYKGLLHTYSMTLPKCIIGRVTNPM